MIPGIRSIIPHPNPIFNKYRVIFNCGHLFIYDYTLNPLKPQLFFGLEDFPLLQELRCPLCKSQNDQTSLTS